MNNENREVVDFSSQISLTTDDGAVYVFNNEDLPKHLLESLDLFCDEVVNGFDNGYTYDTNKRGNKMEIIDYEDSFNEALRVIKELLQESKEADKKIRGLERALHNANLDILSDEEFEIKVWKSKNSNFVDRGSFEHNLLGEDNGGGLWFDPEGRLIDYDGVYQLPSKVIDVLLSEDFIVQEH